MAYAATVTITKIGPGLVLVNIAELECAAGSEATITLGFLAGSVIRQVCSKTAGTATTVDPILGTATAPSTAGGTAIVENATAAAGVNNVQAGGVPFYTATGILYHRSTPDAAADNTISTQYYIRRGNW